MLNLVKNDESNDESYQPEADSIIVEADVFYRAMQAYRFANDDDTRLHMQCVKLIVSKASLRLRAMTMLSSGSNLIGYWNHTSDVFGGGRFNDAQKSTSKSFDATIRHGNGFLRFII